MPFLSAIPSALQEREVMHCDILLVAAGADPIVTMVNVSRIAGANVGVAQFTVLVVPTTGHDNSRTGNN